MKTLKLTVLVFISMFLSNCIMSPEKETVIIKESESTTKASDLVFDKDSLVISAIDTIVLSAKDSNSAYVKIREDIDFYYFRCSVDGVDIDKTDLDVNFKRTDTYIMVRNFDPDKKYVFTLYYKEWVKHQL